MNPEESRYRPPSRQAAWVETVVGTLLVPVLGLLLHRHDPLFLTSSFHWLIFAPLLFGIRYGFAQGFASAALTAVMMLLEVRLAPPPGTIHVLPYIFSVVLIGMIAGQFADVWLRRLGNMQLLNDHSTRRLAEFVRSYQLLKVSHDQLEERLASDTHNARAALMALRRRFAGKNHADLLRLHGRDILEFLSAYSQIQRASLYEVFDNKRIGETPLASVGAPVSCPLDHPMLRACLDKGLLISLRGDDQKLLERQERQKLLAVLPLEDARGHIWAVVTIASMPFVSFHDRNLGMLAVLGAGLGDLIYRTARDAGKDESAKVGTEFQDELAMWSNHAKRYRVPATLMGIRMAPSISAEASVQRVDQWLFDQMRGLDIGLRRSNTDGGHSLMILMPMTTVEGAKGYRERVSLMVEERLGLPLDSNVLAFHEYRVDGRKSPDELLSTLSRECGVAAA